MFDLNKLFDEYVIKNDYVINIGLTKSKFYRNFTKAIIQKKGLNILKDCERDMVRIFSSRNFIGELDFTISKKRFAKSLLEYIENNSLKFINGKIKSDQK